MSTRSVSFEARAFVAQFGVQAIPQKLAHIRYALNAIHEVQASHVLPVGRGFTARQIVDYHGFSSDLQMLEEELTKSLNDFEALWAQEEELSISSTLHLVSLKQ